MSYERMALLGLYSEFSLMVWNGDSLTLSISIGVYSARVSNAVVLWASAAASLGDDVWRAVLEAMIAVFDPDTARVKSKPGAAKVDAMLESWLTYHRGQGIVEHPERR